MTATALFLGVPPFLAGAAVLITLLLAVRALAPWRPLRGCLLSLALLLAGLTVLFGASHVSVTAPSPDGKVVADVYELRPSFDRHFEVRLTTFWLGVIPIRRVVFHSPDEGPGPDRVVWSQDGRYLLLLGRQLIVTRDGCLASGERLYLLVDTQTRAIASNASQARHRRFSPEDLASMKFDVDLTPGAWDQRRQRCAPAGAGTGKIFVGQPISIIQHRDGGPKKSCQDHPSLGPSTRTGRPLDCITAAFPRSRTARS